jgi:hypothetical protein
MKEFVLIKAFFFIWVLKFVSFVQTKQLLSNLPTWQARLKQCTDLLKDATVFPAEQLALAAESFYFKLAAADQYQPMGRFSGVISLVRAKDNYLNLGEDYGLSQVSETRQVAAHVNLWSPGSFLLLLLLLWHFGLFLDHSFPVARLSSQFSFYEVRMSVSRPTPNLGGQGLSLLWKLAQNLSSIGGPTSS